MRACAPARREWLPDDRRPPCGGRVAAGDRPGDGRLLRRRRAGRKLRRGGRDAGGDHLRLCGRGDGAHALPHRLPLEVLPPSRPPEPACRGAAEPRPPRHGVCEAGPAAGVRRGHAAGPAAEPQRTAARVHCPLGAVRHARGLQLRLLRHAHLRGLRHAGTLRADGVAPVVAACRAGAAGNLLQRGVRPSRHGGGGRAREAAGGGSPGRADGAAASRGHDLRADGRPDEPAHARLCGAFAVAGEKEARGAGPPPRRRAAGDGRTLLVRRRLRGALRVLLASCRCAAAGAGDRVLSGRGGLRPPARPRAAVRPPRPLPRGHDLRRRVVRRLRSRDAHRRRHPAQRDELARQAWFRGDGGAARTSATKPPSASACLRAPARPHVRLSDPPRTGRAAEDVGPYHRRGPAREVPAPPSARGVRTGPARNVPAPPRSKKNLQFRLDGHGGKG